VKDAFIAFDKYHKNGKFTSKFWNSMAHTILKSGMVGEIVKTWERITILNFV
jgi:hypothetical protein